MAELIIPKGYVLVPESWAEKYFSKTVWADIQTPTISQVSEYLGVSIEKIRKDYKNIDCPLRRFKDGMRGRGNQTKFLKQSVESYKEWLNQK